MGDCLVPKAEWENSPNKVPFGLVRSVEMFGDDGAVCVGSELRAFVSCVFDLVEPLSMSFGLYTAISVDDIPRILRRAAVNYRNTETRQHMNAWLVAADEIERFADELAVTIDKAKRERVRL